MPDYHIACNTRGQYEASVLKLYTMYNLHYQLCSPFFSVISCSLLIYITLPTPPPIPKHFPIPKLVEIHKLPISIWYIPSKAILVAARTSSVESRGAVPESDEYEKNTNYALIKSTKHRQGSNFNISANYKAKNILPPFSSIEKEV